MDYIFSVAAVLGLFISFVKLVPQSVSVWRLRNDEAAVAGISELTYWLLFVNALLWVILGVHLDSIPVALPSIIYAPIALFSLWLKLSNNVLKFFGLSGGISCMFVMMFVLGLPSWSVAFATFVAPVLAFLLFVPQAFVTWQNRNNVEKLAAISVSSQLLIVLNAVCWGLVAIDVQNFAVGAPGLVNAPLAVFTILLVLSRRKDLVMK